MIVRKHKKKIAIVATVPKMIKFFILPYILELSKFYTIHIYTNKKVNLEALNKLRNKATINHIPITRDINFFNEIYCLYLLITNFYSKKYDLVYSISPKGGFLSTIASIVTKSRNAHVFTGQVWITKKGLIKYILILVDKFIAKFSNLIFVDSHSQRKFLEKKLILDINSNVKIIGNGSISGVDLEKFKIDKQERKRIRANHNVKKNNFIILFVGRLNKDKGIELLIKAFLNLHKENPNILLWMVGDDEGNFEKKINLMGINVNNIHFHKYVDNPMGFMNAGDILCLPSFREGFGNVIIESGACGLTCIGSNIYGITDAIINKKTGLLFSKGDVEDLEKQMKLLIKNTKKREELSKNAFLHVKSNYNQLNYIKSFLEIIRTQIS